jgi:hypothetical protein
MQIAYLIIFGIHKISIYHEIYISKYENHLQTLRILHYYLFFRIHSHNQITVQMQIMF